MRSVCWKAKGKAITDSLFMVIAYHHEVNDRNLDMAHSSPDASLAGLAAHEKLVPMAVLSRCRKYVQVHWFTRITLEKAEVVPRRQGLCHNNVQPQRSCL